MVVESFVPFGLEERKYESNRLFQFQELNLVLSADEVISGVHSIHDDGREDRVWTYKICKIGSIH
jgi:hypothetical protein